jgi:predicted nucleic acid-binding protein
VSAVYDAGALIAADRGDRQMWLDHEARLQRGSVPWTTAPVVAQVSRAPAQARLRRLLQGCHVATFTPDQAHAVGALLGRTGTSDVVDAHVVVTAASMGATILTSDPRDVERLASQLRAPIRVRRI